MTKYIKRLYLYTLSIFSKESTETTVEHVETNRSKRDQRTYSIIAGMLDNPIRRGVFGSEYLLNETCAALEAKTKGDLESAQIQAIGWTWAEACSLLDAGEDIRLIQMSGLLDRALVELNGPE